jgi:glycosyltransferase involved in cell wall biosynthesis
VNRAGPADVALLLEGTYPFVRGGVSSWVHRLIEALPELSFSVVFLGGRRADHGPALYPALPNVRHLECQYLFDPPEGGPPRPGRRRGRCPSGDLDRLHDALQAAGPGQGLDPDAVQSLSRLLGGPGGGLGLQDLLHTDDAWERIREGYRRRCPDGSFTDYFWTIRATHAAIFAVADLAHRLPPARCYHAVSTGYAGLLGALLRHRHGRPLLLTEHGIYTKERRIDLASAERLPGDGDGDGDDDDDPVSGGFGRRLWMRFFEGLGRIAYASADAVIALYDGNRRRQIQEGADPARARVIPNGVNVERFRPLRRARPALPPPVLGFLGRVVPIKDVKCFLRAMKAVIARWPDAEGWIVGPTSEDEGYAAECVHLAAALGLEGRVAFKGFLPPEEVLPRLGLLVLSSISEALPLVVLEAFASGLPVLATDVGACRELVEGGTAEDRALGRAGAVVPIADPEAMARAALGLLRDPERWRAAQQAGIQRVERFYAEGGVLDAYRRLYEEARAWPA